MFQFARFGIFGTAGLEVTAFFFPLRDHIARGRCMRRKVTGGTKTGGTQRTDGFTRHGIFRHDDYPFAPAWILAITANDLFPSLFFHKRPTDNNTDIDMAQKDRTVNTHIHTDRWKDGREEGNVT